MIDDSAERAPIGRIDVSGLPGPDPRPEPDWSTVRKVSESGGFIDRSPRTTRRHLTRAQSSIPTPRRPPIRSGGSTPSVTGSAGSPGSRSSISSRWGRRPCGSGRSRRRSTRLSGGPRQARSGSRASWLVGGTLERALSCPHYRLAPCLTIWRVCTSLKPPSRS